MKDKIDPAHHLAARIDRWVVCIFCFTAIVLGAYQAWDTRYAMNADGVSYLDMGDAYLRGDWDMAINAYWSPFYSWLLGLAMQVIKPSAYWEYPVVHFVNFLIYLCTIACFHFFLIQLIYYYEYRQAEHSGNHYAGLPSWAVIAFGYSLFIWASLYLITISIVTPDMCVAAFVFLASGILLRIRRGSISWPSFIMLGMVLGFSYLAKAFMFPLSFIFLVTSFFLIGDFRKAVPRTFTALVAFLIVAGPFIAALTISKGRLTYGDSGKLNYAWYVNSVPMWTHWQGGPPGNGSPAHPPRKILDKPAVYEFGTPRGGTYPLWYDPSYWYEGVQVYFDVSKQLRIFTKHIREYAAIFFEFQQLVLLLGCFILYFMSRRRWLIIKDIAEQWSLIVPAVAAMGIYALVHVERRFLGAFIVLLWIGAFSGVRLHKSSEPKRLSAFITVFMAMVVMAGAVYSPLSGAYKLIKTKKTYYSSPVSLQVVKALDQMGIRRGDNVAVIGWSENISLARLAGVRIIADIPQNEKSIFLEADSLVRSQILKALLKTGAKVIVINKEMDGDSVLEEWKRIGDTDYYVYNLSELNDGEFLLPDRTR